MKKNGFTLVELMTAIAVVGILAAIALPQFGNALARARAAEVPLNLNKIKSAQEAYKAETKEYKTDCAWLSGDPAHLDNGKELGVKMDPSNFFTYRSDAPGANPQTFTATAKLTKSIGSAEADTEVILRQNDQVEVNGGGGGAKAVKSKSAMELYLRSFINQ